MESERANIPLINNLDSGLTKRIIPCLDIKNGRTVKGVNFINLKDAGNPIELAAQYAKNGADELVFLDIAATQEARKTRIVLVKEIAKELNIPFTIGGGISSLKDADALLNAGADKISINSAAFKSPQLINELAINFGSQFVVVAIDSKIINNQHLVFLNGGSTQTDRQVMDWCKEVESLGAGELLITSMDRDGTKNGFDCDLLKQINKQVNIPIIASGGAGNIHHFTQLFLETGVDAALAASIFHFQEVEINPLKIELQKHNIQVRL